MAALSEIRKKMALQLKIEAENSKVRCEADNLSDALTQAAIELGEALKDIDYEIIDKGFRGFAGLGKRKCVIEAYRSVDAFAFEREFVGSNSENVLAEEKDSAKNIAAEEGEILSSDSEKESEAVDNPVMEEIEFGEIEDSELVDLNFDLDEELDEESKK